MVSVDEIDYEAHFHDDSPKRCSRKPWCFTHVELRGNYPKTPEKERDEGLINLGSLISGPLIEVRGEELAQKIQAGKYRDAVRTFLDTGSITKAVLECPYLRKDYKISPYVAKSIFEYAILNVDLDKLREKMESVPKPRNRKRPKIARVRELERELVGV